MYQIPFKMISADADFAAAVQAVAQGGRVVTIPYATTIAPDANTTDLLIVGDMTGPVTLNLPTGTAALTRKIQIFFRAQTSDRVLTLNASYRIPTGTVVSSPITIAANSASSLLIQKGPSGDWWIAAYNYGFP